jgi:hypothetical protein
MGKLDNIVGYLRKKIYSFDCFNLSRKKVAGEYFGPKGTVPFSQMGVPFTPGLTEQVATPVSTPVSTPIQKAIPQPIAPVQPIEAPIPEKKVDENLFINKVKEFVQKNKVSIDSIVPQINNVVAWQKLYREDPEILDAKILKEITLGVDFDLYKDMKKDSSFVLKFMQVINELTNSEKGKSVFFVFMEKAKVMLHQQIEEQSQELAKIKQEQEPSPAPVPSKGPNLDVRLITLLAARTLPEEKKDEISKWMGMDFRRLLGDDYEILDRAVRMRFGEPGSDEAEAEEGDRHFDQRINFFLQNPQFLSGVIKPEDTVSQTLNQELASLNISGIENVRGSVEGMKRSKLIKLLRDTKGPELYGILGTLIDKLDRSVFEWLVPGVLRARAKPRGSSINAPMEIGRASCRERV